MKIRRKQWLASVLAIAMLSVYLPIIAAPAAAAAFGWTEESFDYAASTKLNTTEPEKGWSTGWLKDRALSIPLEDQYVVSEHHSLVRNERVDMYRGLNTPIQLGTDQVYYLRWTMQVDGPASTNGASRARLALSDNTFFGMRTIDGTTDRLFSGRFLGQQVDGMSFELGKEYQIVVKISASASGATKVGMKVYNAGEVLSEEPEAWDLSWSTQSKVAFQTIGLEANLYNPKGQITFDRIALSARWADIAGTAVFHSREDFDYSEGTPLSDTTADGGWSSGWKANAALTHAMDPSIRVTEFATIRQTGQLAMYRGLVVPVDLKKDADYYLRWKFSLEDGSDPAGRVWLMLDPGNFFGAAIQTPGSSAYQWTAKFLNQQQFGPAITEGEEYTVVVRISAKENGTDKASMKFYASTERLTLEPDVWDIEIEGESDARFNVMGFEAELNQTNSWITLDHIYTGFSWEDIAESRRYYMQDWFDQGANSPLNATFAAEGWTSGWKQDPQLLVRLPDSFKTTTDGNIRLADGESMYRGIMPMYMKNKQNYYISWKMAVEREASSSVAASVYLDPAHYFGIRENDNRPHELQFYASFGEAEADGPTMVPGKWYTIVAKIETSDLEEVQVYVKIYPEGHSASLEPADWDIRFSVHDASVFQAIGFESMLGDAGPLAIDQLTIGTTWEEASQSEERTVGKDLFSRIDLSLPELAEVKRLADREDYEAALHAYKDYFIDKLARLQLGKERPGFGNRGTAEQAMNGYITAYTPPDGTTVHYIGEPGQVQWYVVSEEDPNYPGTLAEMDFTLLLSDAFVETGEVKYMKRWNDYWDDFTRNNFNQWTEALNSPDRDKFHPLNDTWSSRLRLANRSDMFLQQLNKAALAHAESLKQAIDPVTLALTLNLLADTHLNRLVEIQSRPGGAPNQNFQVAISLFRASLTLNDYFDKDKLRNTSDQVVHAYVNEVNGVMMRDGSDLEQSFNYNGTLLELTEQLKALYEMAGETYDFSYSARRLRFLSSLIRPIGNMPGLSKMDNRPYFDKLNDWQANIQDETVQRILDNVVWNPGDVPEGNPDRSPLPAFTSIYYPYGGFAVMRSGWDRNAYHLFMKTSRRGSGHLDESGNQIQLTAFGKTMLVDAGPDSYSPADTEANLNDYFVSSFAHNTMAVDHLTQLMYKTPGAFTGYEQPIQARWLTSDKFEFVEGTYDNGYGTGYEEAKPSLTGVQHDRQVIYVKELGAFIVTDRMIWDDKNDQASHDYTQMWNFDRSYAENDVQILGNSIFTSAAEGPNLEMYHFSAAHRASQDPSSLYTKYYANSQPLLGYFRNKTTEKAEPKVDVHVDWEGHGDQLIVTLIHPFQNNVAAEKLNMMPGTNADHPEAEGFHAKKAGTDLYYQTAKNGKEVLHAGFITVKGEALLAVKSGDEWRGIVLGAESWSVNGKEQPLASANFEFEFRNRDVAGNKPGNILTQEFGVPETFQWVERNGGLVPAYR